MTLATRSPNSLRQYLLVCRHPKLTPNSEEAIDHHTRSFTSIYSKEKLVSVTHSSAECLRPRLEIQHISLLLC